MGQATPTPFSVLVSVLHAGARFLWRYAGFAPVLLYLAWIPFVVLSKGGWAQVPTALIGGEGLTGVVAWGAWAVPFVFNLWPYFSDFVARATFWVLVVPSLVFVAAIVSQNVDAVRSVARAAWRRAARVTPAGVASAASKALSDVALFPATLAASLGNSLVPGGWMHSAVSVATAEVVSYPAALITGAAASLGRLARRAARLDAKGVSADVVREFVEFPALLAAAFGPLLRDLAPLADVLAEIFIGPMPIKGRGVPDLAAFASGVGGDGEEDERAEDRYDFGANIGGAPSARNVTASGFRTVSSLGLGGRPSVVGVPGGRLARVDENATLAEWEPVGGSMREEGHPVRWGRGVGGAVDEGGGMDGGGGVDAEGGSAGRGKASV